MKIAEHQNFIDQENQNHFRRKQQVELPKTLYAAELCSDSIDHQEKRRSTENN